MTPAEQFIAKTTASFANGSFVNLTLSRPVRPEPGINKVLARLVALKGIPHLSLTFRYATRDETKNLPLSEAVAWLRGQLGAAFESAMLQTTQRDWQFLTPTGQPARLVRHPPAHTVAPPRAHDQIHPTFLDASASDWLRGLAILDAHGKIRASMADKHRQIHHYLEILSHLARDCGWDQGTPTSELFLADMGCGKGYLTFGAWQLLRRHWRLPARVLGVEVRPELVARSSSLAKEIGADGLEFVAGTIESAQVEKLDALIALHACNTATDDAIRRGIQLGARLIVVAPCCHQELRPQMGHPEPLAPVLKHGIMAERMAEWLTDGLRALYLEWAGYQVKLLEFIASEHTPKNLMLAAVRQEQAPEATAARERIERLKAWFGIRHHALDAILS